jgi:prepilin-type N-terminal cleavage/methylation domain-containing protein/prepilin-type processing-associated H-X9-DG protein
MKPRPRPAFTLIELLVVIAIIALLIGILLPALSQARSSARAVAGRVNLRSIGMGLQMYADDYDVFFPHRAPTGVHTPTGRPRPRWHWLVSDYLGKPPFLPRDADETQILLTSSDIPRLDNEVFQDPSHTLEDYRSKETGQIQALRNGSYGYNYHYLGNARGGPSPGTFSNYPVRRGRIITPADTVAFATSSGSQALRTTEGFREHAYTLDPPRLDTEANRATEFAHDTGPSPAHALHSGRAGVAWLDGHADAQTLGELGYQVTDETQGLVGVDAGSNRFFTGSGADQ